VFRISKIKEVWGSLLLAQTSICPPVTRLNSDTLRNSVILLVIKSLQRITAVPHTFSFLPHTQDVTTIAELFTRVQETKQSKYFVEPDGSFVLCRSQFLDYASSHPLSALHKQF